LALALTGGATRAASPPCALPKVVGSTEMTRLLSLRAVEVVKRAANPKDGLAALVHPQASFSLGAGDVGRPLGVGASGAQQLARAMNADAYQFLGWDYMDTKASACSRQKVEVNFLDNRGKFLSRVEFTFEAGRVIAATGWQRSFETGRISGAAPR
jgi:hypothetical protein